MFTESDLRELLAFTAPEKVLSVYLNIEPTEGNADVYKLRLKNMLKGVDLIKDAERVENYLLHEFKGTGRSVAIFSCTPKGFFRAYPLAVPVRNWVFAGDRPGVKPMADLMDNFGAYGVVLVDKQGARLFYFHLGELREQEGVLGEEVKHTKRGGASTFPGRRGGVAGRTDYVDELIDRNMKDAADFAVRFFAENKIRRILICGSDENVAQFRTLLPKAWQSLVVGTFAMSMTASHIEVLNKAMEVGRQAETLMEANLVQEMIVAAEKGAGAVLGMGKTLDAVNQDRVRTLLILEGFKFAGFRCESCHFLNVDLSGACPACGAKCLWVNDVVELAVSDVLRHGGDVEVIHSNEDLEKAGKIGALLRY